MDVQLLWELFYMTGEPLAYALYREAVSELAGGTHPT